MLTVAAKPRLCYEEQQVKDDIKQKRNDQPNSPSFPSHRQAQPTAPAEANQYLFSAIAIVLGGNPFLNSVDIDITNVAKVWELPSSTRKPRNWLPRVFFFFHKLQHNPEVKGWLISKRNIQNKQWCTFIDDDRSKLQSDEAHSFIRTLGSDSIQTGWFWTHLQNTQWRTFIDDQSSN